MGRLKRLPIIEYTPESMKAARERSHTNLWSGPPARVTHPTYGTVIVPHISKFGALLCAAEVWGCDWLDIRDAEIWGAEPGEKSVPMPEYAHT